VAGQLHGAAGAGEQRDAELGLQPGDRPGKGRLRDAEQLGGAGHVLLAGHRDELPQQRHQGVERGPGPVLGRRFMHI